MRYKANFLERVKRSPEITLVTVGGGLNLIWEFAHSSLYTDGDRDAWYIVWTRIHCTVGDVMILLFTFYGVSAVYRSRYWWKSERVTPGVLFIMAGLSYTVWSEWYNINVAQTWEYTTSMPTVFGFGLSPLLQWVVGPLVVLWRLKSTVVPKKISIDVNTT